MGTTQIRINERRIFTEEFKKARIKEYENGKFTIQELSRLFGVNTSSIYKWIYKYSLYNKKSLKVVEISESGTRKLKNLEDRIKDLERIVGQKQLEIDYLEKMIELAREKFDIDIKKNSNTPRSGGLEKTNK